MEQEGGLGNLRQPVREDGSVLPTNGVAEQLRVTANSSGPDGDRSPQGET